jgi:hypothetical protein
LLAAFHTLECTLSFRGLERKEVDAHVGSFGVVFNITELSDPKMYTWSGACLFLLAFGFKKIPFDQIMLSEGDEEKKNISLPI